MSPADWCILLALGLLLFFALRRIRRGGGGCSGCCGDCSQCHKKRK
ncbi:MAG TPA: FeoB-associated Cys-rich membrane protein [Candidatus Caccousia avistercoris]|nr:FeoB-associated Cys-rich membrane protein [Candidatus Caccousia avistercoris]